MIAQGRLATQASGVQQVGIQLRKQALALGEERWRSQVAMLAIIVLMQALDVLKDVSQAGEVFFHYHRANAKPSRDWARITGDFSRVAKHEIGFLRCQGIKVSLDLLSSLHQQRFLIGAGGVVRIAQHDHRTCFEVA
ncbi:hypothetical protein D3C86_1892030 [compost metagenome]